jgi:uncharacterized protein with PIN domain
MAKYEELLSGLVKASVQGVTEGGQRDLSTTRLEEMEDEVYRLADELSAQVLKALLQQQAEQADASESCPCCGKALEPKEPQPKTLQLRRGKVHWRQPVRRCKQCRRDFFPSGGSAGV